METSKGSTSQEGYEHTSKELDGIGTRQETTSIDHHLDITEYVCPMTFVRAKLLMERMKPGEVAEILLSGGDPLENVPRAIWEHGYEVISLEPENDDIYKLIIKKPPPVAKMSHS